MLRAHIERARLLFPGWLPWGGLLFGLYFGVSTIGLFSARPSQDSSSVSADRSPQNESLQGSNRVNSAKRSVPGVDCPALSKVAFSAVPNLASTSFAPLAISAALVNVFAKLNGTGSYLRC